MVVYFSERSGLCFYRICIYKRYIISNFAFKVSLRSNKIINEVEACDTNEELKACGCHSICCCIYALIYTLNTKI